jgi:WD40 repeat protein
MHAALHAAFTNWYVHCMLMYTSGHPSAVRDVDFSPDGALLCSLGDCDPTLLHTTASIATIWDWRVNCMLAKCSTGSGRPLQLRFNPYQYYSSSSSSNSSSGTSSACYCLVSAGTRHIKFWTLQQQQQSSTTAHAKQHSKHRGRKYSLKGGVGVEKGGMMTSAATSAATSQCDQFVACGFTALTFINDSSSNNSSSNGSMCSRVVAGTTSGAIYVFVQVIFQLKIVNLRSTIAF